jgi:hypothetical protein
LSVTTPRDRIVEPGDFGGRAIGMPDVTHLTNLFLGLVERTRDGELGEVTAFLLQKFACRSFVEQARDDDIGPEHQYVFRAAR